MKTAAAAPVIGVVDSGVGGLTIYAAIRAALPNANFQYCSDNAHFPYGTRTEEDVVRCVTVMADNLDRQAPLDLLVVACNTASTVVLPPLRARFPFPVVGVVPAIKPAAALTKTGTIGLLATPATVSGPYTDALIAAHADGRRVLKIGSPRLAAWAEGKLRGEAVDLAALRAEVAPFFDRHESVDARVDVVVLGCTHFPLLIEELDRVAAWPVTWLDSASAIASRVVSLVGPGERTAPSLPASVCWFTRGGSDVDALDAALRRFGFAEARILPAVPANGT